MKIKFKAGVLLQNLSVADNVINAKHFVSSLSNGLFIVNNSSLSIVGSDGEMEIETIIDDIDIEDKSDFQTLISVRKLLEYVRFLGIDDEVSLDFKEDDKVIVKSSGDRFSVNKIGAEDYPRLKIANEDSKFFEISLDKSSLSTMIERSIHAVANNDMRQYLNGILFEFTEDSFHIVSTDGHRLSWSEIKIPNSVDTQKQYIVPKKTALELAKLLKDKSVKDTEINMRFSEDGIIFQVDKYRLLSKLINSQYPAYEKVIPNLGEKYVSFNAEQFKKTIQKAAIVASDSVVTSAIKLTFDDKYAFAEAENNIAETLKTNAIEINSNIKEPFKINFNSKYLLDTFSQILTENAGIYLYDSNGSILVVEEGNSASKFVLMPMKLN